MQAKKSFGNEKDQIKRHKLGRGIPGPLMTPSNRDIPVPVFCRSFNRSFLPEMPKTTALVAALGFELLVWPVQQKLN